MVDEQEFEQIKEFVITDFETLRALTDPLKMQILEQIGSEAKTVKQIATRLKVVSNKLYYHINQLEDLGLVKVVSMRVVSGIIEKQYRTIAQTLTISRKLLSLSDQDSEEVNEVLNSHLFSTLDLTHDELKESNRAGLLAPPLRSSLTSSRLNLTQNQFELICERIEELVNTPEFQDSKESDPTQPRQDYRFLFTVFPLVSREPGEQD